MGVCVRGKSVQVSNSSPPSLTFPLDFWQSLGNIKNYITKTHERRKLAPGMRKATTTTTKIKKKTTTEEERNE